MSLDIGRLHQKSKRLTSVERREAILRATLEELASCGFRGARTASIAKRAGTSEALLFSYFDGKRDLFSGALDWLLDKEDKRLEQISLLTDSLQPSTQSLVMMVYFLVHTFVLKACQDQPELITKIAVLSLWEEPGFAVSLLEKKFGGFKKKFEQCYDAAVVHGDISASAAVPANIAFWAVHHMVVSFVLHSPIDTALLDYRGKPADLIQNVLCICLRGIGLNNELIEQQIKYCGFQLLTEL